MELQHVNSMMERVAPSPYINASMLVGTYDIYHADYVMAGPFLTLLLPQVLTIVEWGLWSSFDMFGLSMGYRENPSTITLRKSQCDDRGILIIFLFSRKPHPLAASDHTSLPHDIMCDPKMKPDTITILRLTTGYYDTLKCT